MKKLPEIRLDVDLARRLHRALTAGREELFQVLQDPAMEVLRTVLKNPGLTEEHLLVLLERRDLAEDIPKAIYQREAGQLSHRLLGALARNPATPAPVALTLLPRLHLFELTELLWLPWATPDQKLAAERQILKRLPQVPLGNKLTLARRASTTVVGELLKEGHPQLMEACLANPRLKEVAILQFLNGPGAGPESISHIARHPRWQSRPNLRLAILKNPRTPPIWHTLWLPHLKTGDLRALLAGRRLKPSRKKLVEEELKRRSQG